MHLGGWRRRKWLIVNIFRVGYVDGPKQFLLTLHLFDGLLDKITDEPHGPIIIDFACKHSLNSLLGLISH